MSEYRAGYTSDAWLPNLMIGAWEGTWRFGRAALLTALIFGPHLLPQAEDARPAIVIDVENFSPDMGKTFGQYSRADWVDCVEEQHGHAQVTLPSGDGKAVVGVVGELVMESTGADMPVLSDGATIERQGGEVRVTPLWNDPVTVRPEDAARINLDGDNWIHVGTTLILGQEQAAMTLYCSDTPNN